MNYYSIAMRILVSESFRVPTINSSICERCDNVDIFLIAYLFCTNCGKAKKNPSLL